ncbi:hypothetical protein Aut01nite_32550 [Actinoplanes utahensis]|nr:hypothetical protein Aut01nite_32550 [Actinoplanes utahensis]
MAVGWEGLVKGEGVEKVAPRVDALGCTDERGAGDGFVLAGVWKVIGWYGLRSVAGGLGEGGVLSVTAVGMPGREALGKNSGA